MAIQAILLHLFLSTRILAPPAAEALPLPVAHFIDYLRKIAPTHYGPGNQYRLPKPVETTKLLAFVSSKGLALADAEGLAPGQVGRDRLAKELKSAHGLIYRFFVGLTISAASNRNNAIRFETRDGITRVFLDDFILSFVVEEGGMKLNRLEDTDAGGD